MGRIAWVEGKLCGLDQKGFDWKIGLDLPRPVRQEWETSSQRFFGMRAQGVQEGATHVSSMGQPQYLQEKH